MSPILREQDDIVRDSIIKNKERTKSYWEQLMLTAAAEQNIKTWNKPKDSSNGSNNNSNRNSVCSIEDSSTIEDMKEEIELEPPNVKEEKRRIERELREGLSQDVYHLRMEEKIAQELQEMRQREEELRIQRQLSKKLGGQEELDGVTNVEDLNSQDGSNCSEYGTDEKEPSIDGSSSRDASYNQRSHSLESLSSGHSSGSAATLDRDLPRRRHQVTVRPFEEPDEHQPIFKKYDKETPIEREIRLAREREEELRRSKNTQDQKPDEKVMKKMVIGRARDAVANDTRGVQQRLATNRIQQEIEEAGEREKQLLTEGKILTTSQETVDAKVTRFTQLAEHAIQESHNNSRKMKRSSSTTTLTNLGDNEWSLSRQSSADGPRKFQNGNSQRGVMERFIATKGRLGFTGNIVVSGMTPRQPEVNVAPLVNADAVIEPPANPTRNGFRSAEEKIQDELREMRLREEELRMQRGQSSLSRSQPNLLNICDEPEEDLQSWRSHDHPSLTDGQKVEQTEYSTKDTGESCKYA